MTITISYKIKEVKNGVGVAQKVKVKSSKGTEQLLAARITSKVNEFIDELRAERHALEEIIEDCNG